MLSVDPPVIASPPTMELPLHLSTQKCLPVILSIFCLIGCHNSGPSPSPDEHKPEPSPVDQSPAMESSVDRPPQDESVQTPASSNQPATLEQAQARIQTRADWTDRQTLQIPVNPAQKFLKDWAIVLDPGHGGHADKKDYKRGPTGQREAIMNWQVAVLLKELLDDAGAQVVLTRHGDEAISLQDRAAIANTLKRDRDGGTGADFFLSIHHNISPKATTNWSSVWFHDDPNNSEIGIDVGRYIARCVGEALRTQVGTTSPLMTDRQMYDGGFGVLRSAQVPACLAELSFYSNPEEEQRLRDGYYNLRTAYAIYTALCEYAYEGRPTQDLPTLSPSDDGLTISTVLDDGLPDWWGSDRTRIFRDSIAVSLDGQDLPISYDPATLRLTAHAPASMLDRENEMDLKVRHNNFFKHANWPQRYALAPEGEGWSIHPLPAKRLISDAPLGGS